MKSIALLRTRVGFSQLQLAQYLGVSYSLVAMYEKGRRSMPVAALQKMADLELFLLQPAAKKMKTHPHLQRQGVKSKVKLASRLKNIEFKKMQAERQLAATQKKFNQHLQLLSLLVHLEGLPVANRPHATWLEMMKQQTISAGERHPLHKQQSLELRISSLQFQLEEVTQKMLLNP